MIILPNQEPSANPDQLISWLESKLDPAWLSSSKYQDHPIKYAIDAHYDFDNHKSILWTDELIRTFVYSQTLQALSGFPIKNKSGIISAGNVFRDQLLKNAQQSIDDFYAMELEASVAYAFGKINKWQIHAIEEDKNQFSPDFEAKFRGLPLYVECKARNISTPKHRQSITIRQEIMDRTQSYIVNSPQNYGLSITIQENPDRTTIAGLVKQIKLNLSTFRPFRFTYGPYIVKAEILLEPDEELITEKLYPFGVFPHVPIQIQEFFKNNGAADNRSYSITKHRASIEDVDGTIYYINPKVCVVNINNTPDHVDAVINLIKRKAKKQQTVLAPSITVVGAPDFYSGEQFSRLKKGIQNILSNTTRISGVLLWHAVVEKNNLSSDDWGLGLKWQLYFHRNENARHPLIQSFEYEHLPNCDGFELLNKKKW